MGSERDLAKKVVPVSLDSQRLHEMDTFFGFLPRVDKRVKEKEEYES